MRFKKFANYFSKNNLYVNYLTKEFSGHALIVENNCLKSYRSKSRKKRSVINRLFFSRASHKILFPDPCLYTVQNNVYVT